MVLNSELCFEVEGTAWVEDFRFSGLGSQVEVFLGQEDQGVCTQAGWSLGC